MTSRPRRSGRLALSVLAGVATPIVIIGAVVAVFLTPAWIDFEQRRSGVAAITGFTPDQVRQVTGSILSDLVFGPPTFAIRLDGWPVLDAAERSHMADVRSVLVLFGVVFLAATGTLVAILVANHRAAWPWRAAARGSAALALATLVVGVTTVLFFDAAFLAFHLIFFPQGNFAFDPRTQRLVQLFPERFWSDTALVLGAVLIVFAAVTAGFAEGRARRLPD